MDLSHKIPHRSQSISMKTKRLALFSCILFLLLNIHESHSYGGGAPAIPSICSSMTPEHHTEPQSSPSPYTILLEKTEVMGGQPVKVTLTSVDRRTPFKGFLVMGQKFKEEKLRSVDTPMGQFGFGVGSNSDIAKLIKCGGQSVATHNSSQAKNEVVIEWTAPNEDGEYMIVGTFVQSFDRFWVRQPSAMIRVKKDAGLVVAEAPAPVAPKLSEATTAKLQDFYSGCTSNKACYGLPSGCVESQTCEMLTTFRVAGSRYLFQVTGQLPEGHTNAGYVASGLSFDASMGTDSIIGCVLTANAGVEVLSFYSEGTSIKQLQNFTEGLDAASLTGEIIDNRVFCEFSRVPELQIEEIQAVFNLGAQDYFVLMASGTGPIPENLHYHAGWEHGFSACPLSLNTNTSALHPKQALHQDEFYNGCGVTKGCFGFPNYKCIHDKNCDMFVSFDRELNFQLLGRIDGRTDEYAAVGLSFDDKMGSDSVIACVYKDKAVEARSYYNLPSPNYDNNQMPDANDGIASIKTAVYEDGLVLCEFQRTATLELPNGIGSFDLLNDKYFLLLAKGLLDQEQDYKLNYHDDRLPSPQSVLLSETINIGEPATIDRFYENCGVTKGCFGYPSYTCIADKSCEMFVSFDKDFNFQLLGTVAADSDSYLAVGLSLDAGMAQDSVIACGYKTGTPVEARSYYNIPEGKSNLPMKDPNAGIALKATHVYENGQLFCEFQRTPILESIAEIGINFDLRSDRYHLLLAMGLLNEDFTLTFHTARREAASNLLLSDTVLVDQPTSHIARFYENCGISKGCYGLPSYRCIYEQNCELFVSFDKDFNFQLLGTVSADATGNYIAVGLSLDEKMAQDSVIACGYKDGAALEATSFYNVPDRHANLPMKDPSAGISGRTLAAYTNGQILCEFQRTRILEALDEIGIDFNLETDEYHLLIARGPLDETQDFILRRHNLRGASNSSLKLSDSVLVDEPLDVSDAFYDGCGDTKGCWGLPSYECIAQRNCDMFVSFDKDFNFQMSGAVEGQGDWYLALGLSFDKGMDPTAGLANIRMTGFTNGRIYCEFQRTPLLESPTELGKDFDLMKDLYYLLLAQGPLNSDWTLRKHTNTKASSPTSGLLSNIVIIGAPIEHIDKFYGGCGETKSCLGFPTYECIFTKNCQMFVSFDQDFNFQMIGKQSVSGETYVAVGLSFDDKMGEDSVVSCAYNGTAVDVRAYYNVIGDSNPLTDPNAGIAGVTMKGNMNGDIFCEFQRTPTLEIITGETDIGFDLASDKYYLIAARGEMEGDEISRHYDRKISPVTVELIGNPLIIGAPVSRDDKFYGNCGITKGCFGLPDFNCIEEQNCDMFVSFDKDFNFQILGKPESAGDRYIAVGLSFDPVMGSDSVTGCVRVGSEVQVKSYYNIPDGQNNLKMSNDLDGVATRTTTVYENGKIYCEYQRTPVLESPNEIEATFNLTTDPYYFFLAQGGVADDWRLHQHTTKASSPYPVRLAEPVIIGAELINQFYSGCGETKGCFGMPSPCITYRNCDTFVTFDKEFNFELAGRLPNGTEQGHVSVGLSFDGQMGQDLVTGCAFSGDSFQIYSYYNRPNEKMNEIMEDPLDGLIVTEGEFTDGMLYCQFKRSPILNSSISLPNPEFDLANEEFFILLAKATEVTVGEDGAITALGKHSTEDMAASPESVYLNETAVIGEDTNYSFDQFYAGCTTVKGCFGYPVGCIETKSCDMFASFDKTYRFQLAGKLPGSSSLVGHVSLGLSSDDKMGADSVIGCVYKDGGVSARSYYNIQGGKNNGRMTNPLAGLTGPSVGNYIDGYVFCEFSREEKYVDVNNEIGQDIDLLNGKFHILLARAADISSNGPNGEKLGYHVGTGDKGVSSEAVPMTYIGILKAKSPILVELHGGFMIIAWLMCASTGMFTARYYKQTHTDFNPLNKAFWFLLHISCMFTTAFMTACGIIFIFVEVGGYSEGLNGPASWHPILGIILTVLAAMQVLIAFFRPHPGTPNRPYFNWIHWTIGNSAHIVGIACIFLSQKLSKTGLEENWGYLGVIVAFVIFHVVMHVVMSIHTVWADKQLDIQNKMRAVRPGPMKPSGKSEEAPGTGFRTFMLTLYIFGVAGTSIALVVMVAIAV